ncbi:putative protein NRT1/ PTR FAMILY 5.15, partial [Cocos nucifera]
EVVERFTYGGFASNIISYKTGKLDESMAVGAANVNAWTIMANMLSILGAMVADSWLSHYQIIVLASILYILVR